MSGRIVNVRPKPGFVFDGQSVYPSNVVPLRDTLANVMTGRGTSIDRTMRNIWFRRFQSHEQILAAYLASWLHRKIVDVPAEDMTRAGRDWDATDDEIAKIEKEEERIGYWAKVYEGLHLGRLGGGAILIGMGDEPSTPLPATIKPGGIQYLTVLSRWELTIGPEDLDPASPTFKQPRYFTLVGQSRRTEIHPSRVICFRGLPIPAFPGVVWDDRFWGMSVVEAVDESVQQATAACDGFSALIEEAKIDVYRLNGTVEQLSQGDKGEALVKKRIELTNTGKSIHRAVILDKDDEWDQRQLELAGMRDVIITYDARVAGAADIPATRLFGKSPDGQNATGESDLTNYFQAIGSKQEKQLRPMLARLDAVMLPSAGVKADLSWSFSPLMVLSEKDQAEIELKEAQTLQIHANSGIWPDSVLSEVYTNRLVESQRYPGMKEAMDKALAKGFDPDEPNPAELDVVPVPGVNPNGGSDNRNRQNVNPRARRAANDAATFFADAKPRPLYVQRKLLNAAELIAWAKDLGFTSTLPADDMHVTVLYSRTAVDPMKMGESWYGDEKGNISIKPGGPRAVERLGENAVVLLFSSYEIESRHRDMIAAGGSHDFEDFHPHVTLTYEVPAGLDLDAIKPFTGKLVFGPELFEPFDLDWKRNVVEQ
ncbi:anti-CBASS protein Acb1 family protein [Rhizorhabdus histidinilytica]|uniref:phage portal protein n=1 Tax=Rhizorhabdus histidinilytica TaxID=439228 RepID=UPI00321FF5D4